MAGWSATGLRWEGVPFEACYRAIVEPLLLPGASITHLALRGLDGWQAVVTIEDVLGDDVLIAQNLNGRPGVIPEAESGKKSATLSSPAGGCVRSTEA